MSFPIDIKNRAEMLNVVNSCIATKFTHRFGTLMAELALDAVQCVATDLGNGHTEIDIKNYAKVCGMGAGMVGVLWVTLGGWGRTG